MGGTHYAFRSVWTRHSYLAPPVLMRNLSGLVSRTDLMSRLAAEDEPDIFDVVE